MTVIAACFKLGAKSIPTYVKQIDLRCLATERRDLMATPPEVWNGTLGVEFLPTTIAPLEWREAEKAFLHLFEVLTKDA